MRNDWHILAAVLCASAMFWSGCSKQQADKPQLTPATGTVTLDGAAVDGIAIRFVPRAGTAGNGGSAVTETDGRYTVRVPGGDAGIVPGEYNVVFSKFVMPNGEAVASGIQPESVGAKQVLPPKYTDAETSKIQVSIPQSGGNVDFELKSK